MKVFALILSLVFLVTPAIAEVFDIPAGSWTKVQDGEVTQWSFVLSTEKTRIDLMSYVKDGSRTTYYLIRSACPDGSVASSVLRLGNEVGFGLDCNGNTVAKTSTIVEEVQKKLPPEAMALLKR